LSWFTPWPESHVKKEKLKARELRKTPWWDACLNSGRCHYCENSFQKDQLTMDHKIPIIRGGKSTKSNVVVCCKSCNSLKQHKTDVEFLSEIRKP
jgi:5-methylcytosine-specific restriction enzyme A